MVSQEGWVRDETSSMSEALTEANVEYSSYQNRRLVTHSIKLKWDPL